MALEAVPVDYSTAAGFVNDHHRHHRAPPGWKFGVGAVRGRALVGVAMVGRPVSRVMDDGQTLEVQRLCVREGEKNAASFLYGRCTRAAAVAMGYRRVITYTLASEPGTTLRAVKAVVLHKTRGRSWDTPSRRRTDRHPTTDKVCWQLAGLPPVDDREEVVRRG